MIWDIRRKLTLAGLGIALAVFISIGMLASRNTLQLQETQQWVVHTYSVIDALDKLLLALKDAESAERGYLLTEQKHFSGLYQMALPKIDTDQKTLRRLTIDNPLQQTQLDRLEPLITQKLAWMAESVRLMDARGFDAAVRHTRLGIGKTLMDQILLQAAEIEAAERDLLAKRQQRSYKNTHDTVLIMKLAEYLTLFLFFLVFFVMYTEIEQRRKTEAELRQGEERYRSLVTSVKDYAIILLDPHGLITTWNQGAQQTKGYKAEEIIGQSMQRFYTKEDLAQGRPAKLLHIAASEGRVEDEGWRVRKDGSLFWADVVISAVRDGEGHLRGFSKVTRDLTLRKRNEDKINQLITDLRLHGEELTTVNKELEAFSYSVSHDLRAPLRHISGFADLLLSDSPQEFSDKSKRYLTTIAKSAKQMGRLIDDLLAFSRMGRTDLQKTTFPLNPIIEEIIRDFRTDTEKRDVTWKIAPLPEVHADVALVRQVLINLIANALKYTRTRSKAVIEIGYRPDEKLGTVFFIRDNGVGFDMKYVGKLFGVFQRLHGSDEFEGTGIGLANVRRIIHRHGGQAWAEGVVDQGAVFYFSLPN